MKTRRTMSACSLCLTSCKARSSPTRSRLKKLKRLLLSILPSTARLLEPLERQRLLLMRMNRPLPASRPEPDLHLLDFKLNKDNFSYCYQKTHTDIWILWKCLLENIVIIIHYKNPY